MGEDVEALTRRLHPRQIQHTAPVVSLLRAEAVLFAEAVAEGKADGWHRLNLPGIRLDRYAYERQCLNALDNGLSALHHKDPSGSTEPATAHAEAVACTR